ncbi:MAG: efflux RND transporter permease subunit, partial [Rhodocyclaceae bacterium]|nr:efflux RND transporter permease subunit [Rhodocyclaceae bacterium]
MMPIALGLGVDPSFRSPMAIVVIGGLITSTFLSLLVIPVLFTYVDDGVEWLKRKMGPTDKAALASPAEGQAAP